MVTYNASLGSLSWFRAMNLAREGLERMQRLDVISYGACAQAFTPRWRLIFDVWHDLRTVLSMFAWPSDI